MMILPSMEAPAAATAAAAASAIKAEVSLSSAAAAAAADRLARTIIFDDVFEKMCRVNESGGARMNQS
jgi:cytochrome c5